MREMFSRAGCRCGLNWCELKTCGGQ